MKSTLLNNTRRTRLALALAAVLVSEFASGQAPQLDNDDVPDLSGFWSFYDTTGLERPEQFGDRECLTPEEVQQRAEGRRRRIAMFSAQDAGAGKRVLTEQTNDPSGYNMFWGEPPPESSIRRTSQIVYSLDGQLPDVTGPTKIQHSAPMDNGSADGIENPSRPVRISIGAITCDCPEDFGLPHAWKMLGNFEGDLGNCSH